MGNGKISREDFEKMKEPVRQFYIWQALNLTYCHEKRLNAMEKWQSKVIGGMVVVNILVVYIINRYT